MEDTTNMDSRKNRKSIELGRDRCLDFYGDSYKLSVSITTIQLSS
jgi:hypothetical protein